MLPLFKALGNSFLDLLYPPLCLHCKNSLTRDSHIFCYACFELMEQIDPTARCPCCFSADFSRDIQKTCNTCKQSLKSILCASAFDYEGPAATLVKKLKYGNLAYLAEGGGAFLTSQFLNLGWPTPDYVIPMPMSPLRKMERGYNQSELLAESFVHLTKCLLSHNLKRKGGDFSQAGLNHKQRMSLKSDAFYVKNGDLFHDKILLIIDDVMTTGSSLNCCLEALQPFFPKATYGLTLCCAL